MNISLPKCVSEAMASGRWRNPSPAALRRALGEDLDLPDLELFESTGVMCQVADQVARGGYVDDPEFCMVWSGSALDGADDSRLVFPHALFVGGSVVPGDDVFVVLDLRGGHDDPNVLVLDWHKPIPHRWVVAGTVNNVIDRLSEPRANRRG